MSKFSVFFLSMTLIVSSCGIQSHPRKQLSTLASDASSKPVISYKHITLVKQLLQEKSKLETIKKVKELAVKWERSTSFILDGKDILTAPLENGQYIVIGINKDKSDCSLVAVGHFTTNKNGKNILMVTDLYTGVSQEHIITADGKLYIGNLPDKEGKLRLQGSDKPNCGKLKNKAEDAQFNASVAQVAATVATVATAGSILFGTPLVVVAVAEVLGTDKVIAYARHETEKANEAKKEYHDKCEVPKKK
jgi:hypothetical protein